MTWLEKQKLRKQNLSRSPNELKVMTELKGTLNKRDINGNQYESIFTTKTLRNGTSNYNRITTIVRDRQTAGADASVFYDAAKVITDIHEYVQEEVKETKFDDPFASPSPAPGEDAMPWDNVA